VKVRFSPTAALQRDQAVAQGMSRMLARGAEGARDDMTPEVAEARINRRASLRRTGSYGGGGGGGASGGFSDIQFATGRPRDPLFYWRQNNLPYDFSQNEELAKVRAFCRLLYQTDPIVGSCIDIFTKFPTIGMNLECLGRDTGVLTRQGMRPIGELAGSAQEILTVGGKWATAKFENYGSRRLYKITLRRNRREKTIYATENHRWFRWNADKEARRYEGSFNPASKVSWEDVREIRLKYAEGDITQKDLASEYGITQPAIGQIIRHGTWKNPPAEKKEQATRAFPVKEEAVTADLMPGDRLVSGWSKNLIHSTFPSPFGIAHGMTYGDGSLETSGGGSYITLYGVKDLQMLPYFNGCHVTDPPSEARRNGRRVSGLPSSFRQRPTLDEGTSYLYGWLAGYFAADGTVSSGGECYLDTAFEDNARFIQHLCTVLGIKTYDYYAYTVPFVQTPQGAVYENHESYRVPIDSASLTKDFFCISEHRARWEGRKERQRREEWTVIGVERTDQVEEVFCAKVPETESFVIEGNILTGNCKDSRLEDFHGGLFFDEDHLDYEEFLVDIGREYWTSGEAWPFATFNEDLGIWDDEELLNPDDVKVERSPFLKEPRYFIRLPWTIRQILQTRQPQYEYSRLVQEYPELTAYTAENTFMPVSNVLLRQLKFRGDTFNVRGLPLLTRAMRAMLQKEMLNTALDSIADRLYTPLILCKLGASATDLGTSQPWIPTEDDMENFELALDAALAGDFRALIYNFAVDMAPVLGREQMPDLTPDFERIEDTVLQVFGLSRTLLTGAGAGQTYAADALNKDLVTQLMSRYQKFLARHFRQRAQVVAEAQEHYDYREHGGKRYVIMEEVLETDEETGEKRLVEQPKLLVPELKFKVLNLSDEDARRQFIEALRSGGVPVSQRTRTRGLDVDLQEEEEVSSDEAVRQAVKEQETRRQTFIALRDGGLPIPEDLATDFSPHAQVQGMPAMPGAPGMPLPRLGSEPQPLMALAPVPQDQEEEQAAQEDEMNAPPEDSGGEFPPAGEESAVPPESGEQRKGMPSQAALFRRTASSRDRALARRRERSERLAAEAAVPEEHAGGPDSTWHSYGTPEPYRTPAVVGSRWSRPAGSGEKPEADEMEYLTPG
jgi:hypothetical protein